MPATSKRLAFEAGVVIAVSSGLTPQRVRLREEWLVDEAGVPKTDVRPAIDLSWPLYTVWLRQTALREAATWLEEEFPRRDEPPCVEPPDRFVKKRGGRKAELSDQDAPADGDEGRAGDRTEELLIVCQTAGSPQQRKILQAFLDNDGDTKLAAASLEITTNQLQVQLRRLETKVMAERPDLLTGG